MGKCWLRALGTGGRLVQQHSLERGTVDGAAVSAGNRAIRMEQATELQVHCAYVAPVVEFSEEHQGLRS